jgi:hypothetical protein
MIFTLLGISDSSLPNIMRRLFTIFMILTSLLLHISLIIEEIQVKRKREGRKSAGDNKRDFLRPCAGIKALFTLNIKILKKYQDCKQINF